MSSKIQVQRICNHCKREFTARTTVTAYCSHNCSRAAYKARARGVKVEASNRETKAIKEKPLQDLRAKEFLTVADVARLLGFSLRTTYRLIDTGKLKAVNLGWVFRRS
jgi:excisionase family DNA binding protein